MTKAFALKISMKALFFFVVFLQYNKNRGRLTDLLDSLFFILYALALGTTDNTHLAHFQNINTSHIATDRHIDYFGMSAIQETENE